MHIVVICPNTSNQNFGIAIFFRVVERSKSSVFEDGNHWRMRKVITYNLCPRVFGDYVNSGRNDIQLLDCFEKKTAISKFRSVLLEEKRVWGWPIALLSLLTIKIGNCNFPFPIKWANTKVYTTILSIRKCYATTTQLTNLAPGVGVTPQRHLYDTWTILNKIVILKFDQLDSIKKYCVGEGYLPFDYFRLLKENYNFQHTIK